MWQWCSEYTAEAPSTGRRPLTRRCAGVTRTPAPANLSPPQAPAASATDAAQRPVCAPTAQRTLSKGLPRLPRAIPRDAWRGGKAQPRGTPRLVSTSVDLAGAQSIDGRIVTSYYQHVSIGSDAAHEPSISKNVARVLKDEHDSQLAPQPKAFRGGGLHRSHLVPNPRPASSSTHV
jgi:hypothetical protein